MRAGEGIGVIRGSVGAILQALIGAEAAEEIGARSPEHLDADTRTRPSPGSHRPHYAAPMLERWTRAVVHWRFIVIGLWIAIVVIGVISATRLPGLLSTSLAVPGTPSERADTILARHFAENTEGSFTVVYPVAHASHRTIQILDQHLALAARVVRTGHATKLTSAPGILYANVNTSLDLQTAATYTDALRRALAGRRFPVAYVTGEPAIQHDVIPILASDLHRGEIIAVPVALILLIIILGFSPAVLTPLVIAACTSTATFAILYVIAREILIALYVPNLVLFIGLGLAVDYSLLIVHRFKEELGTTNRSVDDAIVNTMATAGRTVLFSGVAVAIGLSAMLIVPVPFVRSLGIAGCLVPLVSMAATLTLQPTLLSLLGRGGVQGVHPRRSGRTRDLRRGLWSRIAHYVTRHPVAVQVRSTAALLIAIVPIAWLHLTPGSISAIPQHTGSARGLALLSERVGLGAITPIEVVFDAGAAGKARVPAESAATLRLARELVSDPEVYIVEIGSKPPYIDSSGRYGRVVVIGRHGFGDSASRRLVSDLRRRYIPAARFPPSTRVFVGGAPAEGVDFLARVYGVFPWIILIVLVLAYFVMLRAFRSLLLPLIAIFLDAISIVATYGLLVAIFRFGIGADVLGLARVSQIEGWVPVFLFAVLFGLSMDYEFFFVRRMREAWVRGADAAGAITEGLERTGRIVTAAALIMVGALAGLVFGRVADLQELGVGLTIGVLLDATVVRGLLLPSLMALIGPRVWWLPTRFARRTRIEAPPSSGDRGGGLESARSSLTARP